MKRLFGVLMMLCVMVGMSVSIVRNSPTGDGKGELLVWTTTWSDGSVKNEYQYYHHPETNKRRRDGWYNSYYTNGEYDEVGTYKEDVKDGEWVQYDILSGEEIRVIWKDGEEWSGKFWTGVEWDIYKDGECVRLCEGDE